MVVEIQLKICMDAQELGGDGVLYRCSINKQISSPALIVLGMGSSEE